jgi:predicted enzyme related to lactoylglutathione lyase
LKARAPNPLVHLELHTNDGAAAAALYERLAGWWPERVEIGSASYLMLDLGGPVEGGIVECRTERASWLPYVGVDDIGHATDRARELGAAVLLEPREGPVGWRSVIALPSGGELGLWQPKYALAGPSPAPTRRPADGNLA